MPVTASPTCHCTHPVSVHAYGTVIGKMPCTVPECACSNFLGSNAFAWTPPLPEGVEQPIGNRCAHYDAPGPKEVLGRLELTTLQDERVIRARILLCDACVERARHFIGSLYRAPVPRDECPIDALGVHRMVDTAGVLVCRHCGKLEP